MAAISEDSIGQTYLIEFLTKVYYDKYFPLQSERLKEPYTAEVFVNFSRNLVMQVIDYNSVLYSDTYNYFQSLSKFEITAIIYIWGIYSYIIGSINIDDLSIRENFTSKEKNIAELAGYCNGVIMAQISKIIEKMPLKDDQYKQTYFIGYEEGKKHTQIDINQKIKDISNKNIIMEAEFMKSFFGDYNEEYCKIIDKITNLYVNVNDNDYFDWETDSFIDYLKIASPKELEVAIQFHTAIHEIQGSNSHNDKYWEIQYKIYYDKGYQLGYQSSSNKLIDATGDGYTDGFMVACHEDIEILTKLKMKLERD